MCASIYASTHVRMCAVGENQVDSFRRSAVPDRTSRFQGVWPWKKINASVAFSVLPCVRDKKDMVAAGDDVADDDVC